MQSNNVQIYTYFRLNDEEKNRILEKHLNIKPCACACEDFALVLKSNGTVEFVGTENTSAPNPAEWHGVKKLRAGKRHIAGLRLDGSVVAAGSNEYGQCDVLNWKNISDVFAKHNCTYGITEDGKTLVAGQVEYDVFSDGLFLNNLTEIIKNVVYEVMQEQESANDERLDLISDIIADLQSKQNILLDKIFLFNLTNLIKNIVYQTVKEQGFVDKEKIDLIIAIQ